MILCSQQPLAQHVIVLILQIKKLKFRKVEQQVQDNPPYRSQSQCHVLPQYIKPTFSYNPSFAHHLEKTLHLTCIILFT